MTLRRDQKNPYLKSNFISRAFFLFMIPIFRKTNSKNIPEDIFQPFPHHNAAYLGTNVEKVWFMEKKKRSKYALHYTFIRYFGFRYLLNTLAMIFNYIMIIFLAPYLLTKIINFFDDQSEDPNNSKIYIYTGAMALYLFISTFIKHTNFFSLMQICMEMRICSSNMIYKKSLRLNSDAKAKTTVGHMINLLSNDVRKFEESFHLAPYVLASPILTSFATYLVYKEMGVSALVGMVFLWLFVPIQAFIGRKISKIRFKITRKTDERVRLTNEIICAMQVIKMYCWEKPFAALVEQARRLEMKGIKSRSYYISSFSSFEFFVTRAALYFTLLTYVLLNTTNLSAEKVYAVSAILNLIKLTATNFFSYGMTGIAEVSTSLKRIEEFLRLEEIFETTQQYVDENDVCPKKSVNISIKNASFKWLTDNYDDVLEDFNINIDSSELVSIIGPVGSGKSSLLQAMMGEMIQSNGSINIQGVISYASQEPWLFLGSVKENILFGEPYQKEKYDEVVNVCALRSDFNILPNGDQSLVSENGKNLSGGQRARIGLARAVYRNADIYLFDDPLSAVDSKVGNHIYSQCVSNYLKDKMRIIVTHQIQYIQNCDQIILIEGGKIIKQGKYNELKNTNLKFTKLLTKKEDEKNKTKLERQPSIFENDIKEYMVVPEDEEMLKEGRISFNVYLEYFKSVKNNCKLFFLFASVLIGQAVTYGGDYFLSYWVENEEQNDKNSRSTYLTIYSVFIGATVLLSLLYCIYFFIFFINASANIHHSTFNKLMKATMEFFNANPSGRILNRFSKDLGAIDEYIPLIWFDLVTLIFTMLGIFIITIVVQPYLIIGIILLIISCLWLKNFYIQLSRLSKRKEAIARSPIFSFMSSSVLGTTSIRAFHAEEMMAKKFEHFQDIHSGTCISFLIANRAFGFWLDLSAAAFIVGCILLLTEFRHNVQGAQIGLIITQFNDLLGNLQWFVRQWSELENQMVSVERVLEYTKIQCEEERDKKNLPVNWPNDGNIEFKNVYLKYKKDNPPVLKNLNIVIKANEKIGVVGRTGAGKSSLISTLFQLYPLEGKIIIDDVEVTSIPLSDVRTKLGIIPQEPFLFSNTMRKNLDPFDQHQDDVIWRALQQVELKEVVSDLPGQLQHFISEGGSNFSIGQRQLVCLARALIAKKKILILDEATANVDPYTDGLIQKTIREQFSDCTVITIAHRLNTIMDSDKILVMDDGKVVEFNSPSNLLKIQGGIFRSLVKASGNLGLKSTDAIK